MPELARFLVSHPDQVVLLEHRDLDERLAIITESRLRYLETTVTELKKQATRPFRLSGSIKSPLSGAELEVALLEMRKEANQRAVDRINEIVG